MGHDGQPTVESILVDDRVFQLHLFPMRWRKRLLSQHYWSHGFTTKIFPHYRRIHAEKIVLGNGSTDWISLMRWHMMERTSWMCAGELSCSTTWIAWIKLTFHTEVCMVRRISIPRKVFHITFSLHKRKHATFLRLQLARSRSMSIPRYMPTFHLVKAW